MEAVLERRPVRAVWLGRVGYDEALALQREAAERVAAGGEETLFLLEHEPVFTLGRNASASDILFTPERCRELGIAIRETNRGGKVTYHGPGQLVGYPILNLSPGPQGRQALRHGPGGGPDPDARGLRDRRRPLASPRARHVGLGRQRQDRRDRRPPLALDHDARLRVERHATRRCRTFSASCRAGSRTAASRRWNARPRGARR